MMNLHDMTNPQNMDWGYDLGKVSEINFCIWILLSDGLKVAPFQYHPDGTSELRQLGLTAEAWNAWFYKVVYCQNTHLSDYLADEDEQQEYIDDYLKQIRQIKAFLPWRSPLFPWLRKDDDFDELAVRMELEKKFREQAIRRKKAKARAYPYGNHMLHQKYGLEIGMWASVLRCFGNSTNGSQRERARETSCSNWRRKADLSVCLGLVYQGWYCSDGSSTKSSH